MRYCKSFLDYMSEFLLQGASNTWEGKGQVSLPGAAVGVCRVVCVRTRGGCSYGGGVARSIVGAPPRCEASQTNTPSLPRSHPGRVLLQGGGTRSVVGAPPRCEPSQTNTPSPPCSHPGRVLLPVLRGNEKAPASFDARAFDMAQRTGLEPATPGVTGRYSNRLNYRCASV